MVDLLIRFADPTMQDQINSFMAHGHASFDVNLLVSASFTSEFFFLINYDLVKNANSNCGAVSVLVLYSLYFITCSL
jgi:hypothetical protein